MPAPEPEIPAIPRHARITKVASRIVLAAALLFIAAAAALFAFRQTYDDKIYPGVYVAGVELGGMSEAEAREALEARAAEIESSRAYLDALDRHWAPTLAELGATVDVESSVAQAMAIGREEEGRARVDSVLESLREDTWLPLTIDLSQSELEAWAVEVDEELGIRPHDAEMVIENGSVSIIPEVNGTVVDVAELQQILQTSIARLEAPTSHLPLVDFEPRTFASDFEPSRKQLESALAEPITLEYGNSEWTVEPAEFGEFLVVSIDPDQTGPESVSVEVDNGAFAKWLSEMIGPTINEDPTNAKVAWDGKTLRATAPGIDGLRLLPTSLAEDAADAFFTDHRTIDVPVQVLQPEVNGDNLDQLGITTKLAAGSSNFDGSDDARATNIQVGVDLLNGTLVPPGGEFSFNHAIGVISTELGFVEADVIDGERIGRDVGGGICQVSTTVFRAALYAGMPISEWWHHRYKLGFYELDGWTPGLDASILQPEGNPFGGGDFKFINPTDSWLLVEAYVEWPRAYVVLYGPELNYDVEISEPAFGAEYPATSPVEIVDTELPAGTVKQTEWASGGQDISYYRTVYDASGNEVLSDTYNIYFAPRGNVYKVSPDMQGFSPAA
jgi:vancomycin resistance protein YoaR